MQLKSRDALTNYFAKIVVKISIAKPSSEHFDWTAVGATGKRLATARYTDY